MITIPNLLLLGIKYPEAMQWNEPILGYPLVVTNSLLLKIDIEIVDLSSYNMVIFHSKSIKHGDFP